VVARYAALSVIWQLVGEYNDGSVTRAWELGELTRALDPYNHPQSMHARETSAEFAGESWFDFIIYQPGGRGGNSPFSTESGLRKLGNEITLVRKEYPLAFRSFRKSLGRRMSP